MQLYISAKATFSQDAGYWNSSFSTANLVFTVTLFMFSTANLVFKVTLFIYHLVINPGVFRSNSLVCTEWYNIIPLNSIKYHEQKFCIKFVFQSSIEQTLYLYIQICENSVFGVSIKIPIPVLNFSIESAKKLTLYDLLFLVVIYSPNSDNKHQ